MLPSLRLHAHYPRPFAMTLRDLQVQLLPIPLLASQAPLAQEATRLQTTPTRQKLPGLLRAVSPGHQGRLWEASLWRAVMPQPFVAQVQVGRCWRRRD